MTKRTNFSNKNFLKIRKDQEQVKSNEQKTDNYKKRKTNFT